mgnify:FL=1
MNEENINYKKLTPKYLIEAEKFFPPDWSYDKNNQFRTITSDIVLETSKKLQEKDLTLEQVNFIMQKIANWCAWVYIDAEVLPLKEMALKVLFKKFVNKLADSYISCLKKEYTAEECDEILDGIAKDKYSEILDSFLTKGLITKRQALDSKNRNAKEHSSVNIEYNNKNDKNLKQIITALIVCFGLIPLIISFVAKIDIIAVILASLVIAFLCYWIFMIIQNWRLKKRNEELAFLKACGSGEVNSTEKYEGISEHKKSGGHEIDVNQIVINQTINSNQETRGQIQDKGMRSLILVRAGKRIMPYTQGYIEGSLPVCVAKLRNKLIAKYNFELPPVQVQEDKHLSDCEYKIIIRRQNFYEATMGKIFFSESENAKSPMEDLASHIEKCVEKHINKLKGWEFAKEARAEDFKNDL